MTCLKGYDGLKWLRIKMELKKKKNLISASNI